MSSSLSSRYGNKTTKDSTKEHKVQQTRESSSICTALGTGTALLAVFIASCVTKCQLDGKLSSHNISLGVVREIYQETVNKHG